MNRIARWMMRLYPARWRRRYGDELDALLTDTGADARVIADLFKGGVRMRLSTWSFPRLAAMLGLLGMLVGLGISLLTPPNYVARRQILLTGADSAVLTTESLRSQVTRRTSLSVVINDPKLLLYSDLLKTIPLEDVIEQMRRDIAIQVVNPAQTAGELATTIEIRFAYPDPIKAQRTVNDLAANFAAALHRMSSAKYQGGETSDVDVMDPPGLPTRPLALNLWMTGASGLAAGLLAALLWRLLARRPRAFGRTTFRLALASSLAGVAMVWVVAWAASPSLLPDRGVPLLRYQSTAKLYARMDGTEMASLLTRVTSRTSLASIIADPRLRLYPGQTKTHSLDEIAVAMRRDLVIGSRDDGRGTQWIDLSFTYPDRFKSQQTVQALIARLDEEFRENRRGAPPPSGRPLNWGVIEAGAQAVSVESVTPWSISPILTGFLIGLSLAAVIALFRCRWKTDDGESVVRQSAPGFHFDGARFFRLAISLTAAGAVAGVIVAWRTPARYKSEALVAFESDNSHRAAALIGDSVTKDWSRLTSDRNLPGRDLTWGRVDAGGAKTDAFRFEFVSATPESARAVLQDLLGAIDRGLMTLHGGDDTPFESIRGVDGVLLPVTGWPDKATEPPGPTAIPFDDERAKPVAQPQFRSVRMNVIDTPSLPSTPERAGWWMIAAGAAAGFALAALLSLPGGFGSWFRARRTTAVAGASLP